MCKSGGEPDTHLQSDRQHTNWADEQRHKGEPSSVRWSRHRCDGERKTLEREVWRSGLAGVKRRGKACKQSQKK